MAVHAAQPLPTQFKVVRDLKLSKGYSSSMYNAPTHHKHEEVERVRLRNWPNQRLMGNTYVGPSVRFYVTQGW